MKFFPILILLAIQFIAFSSYGQGQHSLSAYKKNQPLMVSDPQQAARIAKQHFGGRVLKVSKHNNRGQKGYKVKLIKKDGHIISVLVNAHNGSVSKG